MDRSITAQRVKNPLQKKGDSKTAMFCALKRDHGAKHYAITHPIG